MRKLGKGKFTAILGFIFYPGMVALTYLPLNDIGQAVWVIVLVLVAWFSPKITNWLYWKYRGKGKDLFL